MDEIRPRNNPREELFSLDAEDDGVFTRKCFNRSQPRLGRANGQFLELLKGKARGRKRVLGNLSVGGKHCCCGRDIRGRKG